MATLIGVYTSQRCIGRCDANCYDAHTGRCSCICGGANHSLGFEAAQANVMRGVGLTAADLARFAADHDLRCDELVAIDRLAVPDARAAYSRAYTKLHQLELPFEDTAHG